MIRSKRYLRWHLVVLVACGVLGGCVVAPRRPPPPPPPGPGCVWVPAHWGGRYGDEWIRAHWRCP